MLVAPTADYSGPIHTAIVTNIIAALVVILLLTGAIYVIFERRIERPIQHLLASAEKIADGDLTAEVTSEHDDELGRLAAAISTMAEDIRKVMQKISSTSETLSAASEELSSTAEQSLQNMNNVAESVSEMAMGVQQQKGHIDDAATSVGSIDGSIGGVQRLALETLTENQASIDAMNSNRASLSEAVGQMSSIRDRIDGARTAIVELGHHSEDIQQIVGTAAASPSSPTKSASSPSSRPTPPPSRPPSSSSRTPRKTSPRPASRSPRWRWSSSSLLDISRFEERKSNRYNKPRASCNRMHAAFLCLYFFSCRPAGFLRA